MADAKENSAQLQLLQPDAHLLNQMLSYVKSESLRCAVQLGIPDAIHRHGKPMKLSQLIAALPIHPAKAPHMCCLMRVLVDSGICVLEKADNDDEKEQSYALTSTGRHVLKDAFPAGGNSVLLMLDPIHRRAFHFLNEWFMNDDPSAFHTAFGMSYWDYTAQDPRFNKLFNEAMAEQTATISKLLTSKWKHVFEGLTSLVDVGGGTGTLARTVAQTFPHLKCTVFDLPHVIGGLQGSQNLDFIGGDMFKRIPSADAVSLKGILHDWNDEESVKILKRCKEAIPSREKGGKVIIIELLMEAENQEEAAWSEAHTLFDMQMMAVHGGKERSKQDWESLFFAAGFIDYKIVPGNRWSLIEVYH